MITKCTLSADGRLWVTIIELNLGRMVNFLTVYYSGGEGEVEVNEQNQALMMIGDNNQYNIGYPDVGVK